MDREKVKKAIWEATRFINKATELLQEAEYTQTKYGSGNCPRESGATRRASMDLTRSLADMRRAR